MKKRAVSVFLIFLLVICGCGETKDKKEAVEEVKQEATVRETEEEKTEGVRIVFVVVDEEFTEEELNETIYKIRKRIENVGIENATVYRNAIHMINIDIPNVTEKNVLPDDIGNKGELFFVLGEEIILDRKDIRTAENSWAQSNGTTENVVVLSFTEDGAEKFARITEANIGETISIVYDGEVISAPIIQQAITDGKAIISGGLIEEEAEHLATVIRVGELPLNLREFNREVVEIK